MPWAAMPQARKPTSTTAAKGLLDHEPNEVTTAVVTGIEVLARDHRGRVADGRA